MNLYPHQAREVERYGLIKVRGLLWCPRAGKSRAILATALRMKEADMIDRMIIISPNGVHENWVHQELYPELGKEAVWYWNTHISDGIHKDSISNLPRAFAALSIPSHLFTMDRAQWFFRWAKSTGSRTLLVVDESDDYSSPSSKRSRRIRSLAPHCIARRILTGTPWHDSILNAWSQMEILSKGLSGYRTYHEFSRRYGIWKTRFGAHGSWPHLVGYQHVDELMSRVYEHCSILTPDDIPGMPRTKNRLINLDMDPLTARIVNDLVKMVELESAGVIFGKIQQTVGLDPRRIHTTIDLAHRYRVSLIWCRYRKEIEELKALMPEANTWYGDTPSAEREFIRERMRYDSGYTDPFILIAQPQACGRGLDFSRTESLIFHSHLPSARLHHQALNRGTAIGSGTTIVYYLCNSGIDAHIIQRLRLKTRFARITLADLEELIDYSIVSSDARMKLLWRKVKGVDITN